MLALGLLVSLVQGRLESAKRDHVLANDFAPLEQGASKLPLEFSPLISSELPEAFADDEELTMRMEEAYVTDCISGHCSTPSSGVLAIPLESIPSKARELIKPYLTDPQGLEATPLKEAVVDGCTRDLCVQSPEKVLVLPMTQLPPEVLVQFLTLVNQRPKVPSKHSMLDEEDWPALPGDLDGEEGFIDSPQRSVSHATLPPIAPPKLEQGDKVSTEPPQHDINDTAMASLPPLVPENPQTIELDASKVNPPQPVHMEAPPTATTQNEGGRSGEGTYYFPEGGYGACGTTLTNNDAVVAMSFGDFGGDANPNNSPMCGREVEITTGKGVVRAKVADKCEACKPDDLDMTPSVFEQVADMAAGRVPIAWKFVDPPSSQGTAAA
ncbi:hypothetical protein H4R35_003375 [Dimargaris xerosporica]|nr:hypothetical protein H4R35_003375 [Dimargaris xerosporica]